MKKTSVWLASVALFVTLWLLYRFMTDPRKLFVADMAAAIGSAGDLAGIPPDFIIAHFAHESGFGSGAIYKATRNPGSVTKSRAWTGPVYVRKSDGMAFKVYGSLVEAVRDYVALIKRVYPSALTYKADTLDGIRGYARELVKGGYVVGDPNYVAEVSGIWQSITGK